jgi:hypothetical protein
MVVKLTFISYGDAYRPPKRFEQTREARRILFAIRTNSDLARVDVALAELGK